jgi:hypothetical protein
MRMCLLLQLACCCCEALLECGELLLLALALALALHCSQLLLQVPAGTAAGR